MARTLTRLLLLLVVIGTSAHAYADEPAALALFDVPKDFGVAARIRIVAVLAGAGHPLAGVEQTAALFDKDPGQISSVELEAIRVRAGLAKLIIIDSAVPPKNGEAVYRIRIFGGEEPQLRFQAATGEPNEASQTIADSVKVLVEDFAKGRSASH